MGVTNGPVRLYKKRGFWTGHTVGQRETMIMGMLPAKQLNNEDPLSGPAVSSVAPSGVTKNMTSDRDHDD